MLNIQIIIAYISITCASTHNSQLTTHNCDEVAPPSRNYLYFNHLRSTHN